MSDRPTTNSRAADETPRGPSYVRKTLLKRRSIRLKDRKTARKQTQAFEEGKAMRFYTKEAAKKLAHPAPENGKIER